MEKEELDHFWFVEIDIGRANYFLFSVDDIEFVLVYIPV